MDTNFNERMKLNAAVELIFQYYIFLVFNSKYMETHDRYSMPHSVLLCFLRFSKSKKKPVKNESENVINHSSHQRKIKRKKKPKVTFDNNQNNLSSSSLMSENFASRKFREISRVLMEFNFANQQD